MGRIHSLTSAWLSLTWQNYHCHSGEILRLKDSSYAQGPDIYCLGSLIPSLVSAILSWVSLTFPGQCNAVLGLSYLPWSLQCCLGSLIPSLVNAMLSWVSHTFLVSALLPSVSHTFPGHCNAALGLSYLPWSVQCCLGFLIPSLVSAMLFGLSYLPWSVNAVLGLSYLPWTVQCCFGSMISS